MNKLLDSLQANDILVVSKLDRFARNTVEGIKVVEQLFKKKVAIHILNIGLLEDTPMGRFFLTTMLAVAELERNMIVERTQEGKAVARTQEGFKEGRPIKYTTQQIKHALSLLTVNGGNNSYSQVEEVTGINKRTLMRYQKKFNL